MGGCHHQIANMPDDSAQQPAPVKPMLEGYAVSDIAHVKDRKKDKKVYICLMFT